MKNKTFRYIPIIVLCITVVSCISSKEKYYLNHIRLISEKYGLNASITKTKGVEKRLRNVSLRRLKLALFEFEKVHALQPDTVRTKEIAVLEANGKITTISRIVDSIYSNKNKINFIIKNNLKTKSMVFVK